MSGQSPRPARRRIAGERRPAARAGEPQPASAPADRTDDPGDDRPRDRRSSGSSAAPADPPVPSTTAAAVTPVRRSTAGPSWLVVAVAGAVALLLVAVVAVLGLGVWDFREVRADDQVAQATRDAPAAAEKAAVAILSYGYTTLDADERSAERYMTPAYAKKYASTFRLVKQNAPGLKAKVEAQVKASGVTHADAHRATVLVYVDQTTTSTANSGQPQLALNRVQMSMVETKGTWLVDDITSY